MQFIAGVGIRSKRTTFPPARLTPQILPFRRVGQTKRMLFGSIRDFFRCTISSAIDTLVECAVIPIYGVPPLLLVLWREQRSKGHEQTYLDFTFANHRLNVCH
jgi:hypothetical protein